MKDPLKQGLKHLGIMPDFLIINFVEVKDPLKQGLKPKVTQPNKVQGS